MNIEEADTLLEHYTGFADELAAMKHKLALLYPEALRYIEALEMVVRQNDTDLAAMTEEEEEHWRNISKKMARRYGKA